MAYQQGEIYFIREREAGALTPFVKIGLVRYSDGRDSFSRVLEHQTGNPRQLVLDNDHVVKTDAVNMVEAQLHRIFASSRISGEWFRFDDAAGIPAAIAKAKELALDAANRVKVFEKAEALRLQSSTTDELEPTPELTAMANRLAMQKGLANVAKALSNEIRDKFVVAAEAGEDVSGVTRTTVRTFQPKLDLDALKGDLPDIFSKYQAGTTKWDARFLLKAKPSTLDPDLVQIDSTLSRFDAQIDASDAHGQVQALNEMLLELVTIRGLAEWEAALLTAQLQVAMGTASAIKGLCTWKRAETVTSAFNESLFATENPDLYKKYMVIGEPVAYTRTTKKKVDKSDA